MSLLVIERFNVCLWLICALFFGPLFLNFLNASLTKKLLERDSIAICIQVSSLGVA